jgi:hypothetical protein
MSKLEQSWAIDAIDAISIKVPETRWTIEGSSDDRIILVGDVDERQAQNVMIQVVDRWLQIHQSERPRGMHFTLRLPRQKAWVIDLSAWWGEIHVKDLQTRLQVRIGKGDLRVEHCDGHFDLVCGQGNVEVKDCTEMEMPPRPPLPVVDESPDVAMHRERGEFRSEFRPRRSGSPWDWMSWNEEDWTHWGLDLAEQATSWASYLSRFFTNMDWKPGQTAIHLQTGKGDLSLEHVEAETCSLWLGKGDVKMDKGRIANLEAYAGRGDIKCQGILPMGDWAIKTSHGNIDLTLPSDTQAKLDLATRRGDIRSDIPLVRVARPGPESRHGGRMVGTIGDVDGKSSGFAPSARAQVRIRAGRWTMVDKEFRVGDSDDAGDGTAAISLATVNGDIKIELQGPSSYPARPPFTPKPVKETANTGAIMTEENSSARVPSEPSAATGVSAEPVVPTAPPAAETTPSQPSSATVPLPPADDPQLAVLQALSQGQISVEEAERLLRNLES